MTSSFLASATFPGVQQIHGQLPHPHVVRVTGTESIKAHYTHQPRQQYRVFDCQKGKYQGYEWLGSCCWSRLARPANLKHPPQTTSVPSPHGSSETPARAPNPTSFGRDAVIPTSTATCRRIQPANEKPIVVDGPPFISELKLSVLPATQTGLHILHIINGRDCGLPLISSVFTSKEVVYISLANSHSLQLFLLIQANQANAPATDGSSPASIDAADRLEIFSNSV